MTSPPTLSDPRYHLLRPIGEGGQARVWLGEERESGERVTLRPSELDRAVLERRIGLRHPCLVEWRGATEGPAGPWTVEEYVAGELCGAGVEPTPAELLSWGRLLLHALACLHDHGLAHGDIHPRNLVLSSGVGERIPVLIDFGLATLLSAPRARAGSIGTIAPEQLAGRGDAIRGDLFGLGCTLLALAGGRDPDPRWSLEPETLHTALRAAPTWLRPALTGLVSPEPRERFENAERALEAWPAAEKPTWTPAERWPFVGDRARCSELARRLADRNEPALVCVLGEPGVGRARWARQLQREYEQRRAFTGSARRVRVLRDVEGLDDSLVRLCRADLADGLVIATTASAELATGLAALASSEGCVADRVELAPLSVQGIAELRRYVPLPDPGHDEDLARSIAGRPGELAALLLPARSMDSIGSAARLLACSFVPLRSVDVPEADDALCAAEVLPTRDGRLQSRSPRFAAELRGAMSADERRRCHAQLVTRVEDDALANLHACLSGDDEKLGMALETAWEWLRQRSLDAAARASNELFERMTPALARRWPQLLSGLIRDLARASRLSGLDETLQRLEVDAEPRLLGVHAYVASEVGDPARAASLAQQALEADPDLDFDVWIDWARALQWQSRWQEAMAVLERARPHARDDADRAHWARIAGLVAFRSGDATKARELCLSGIEHAKGSIRLGLMQNLAMIERHRGEWREAVNLLEEAAEGFLALGDVRNAAIAWINCGIALQDAGQLRESMELRERALQVSREAQLAQVRDVGLAGLGIVAAARGAWTRAEPWLAEAAASLAEQGLRREARLAELHRLACRRQLLREAETEGSLRRLWDELRGEVASSEGALCWRILLDSGEDARVLPASARALLRAADHVTRLQILVRLHAERSASAGPRAERSRLRLQGILREAALPVRLDAAQALFRLATDEAFRRSIVARWLVLVRRHDSPAQRSVASMAAIVVSRFPACHARALLRDCAELETLQRGGEEDPMFESFQTRVQELREIATAAADREGGGAGDVAVLESFLTVQRTLSDPSRSEGDSLREILEHAMRLARAARGFLMFRSEDGRERLACSRTHVEGEWREESFEFSRSLLDEVLERGRSRVTVNALEDPEWQFARSVVDFELASIACVPIPGEGQALGVLYLDNPFESGRFREDILPLLEAFATQVALATLASRKQREIARLNEKLEGRLVATRTKLEEAERELADSRPRRPMIYCSEVMERLMQDVRRFAASDLPVHVRGETGTGKELVARKLHELSARREGPFVSENCSAIASEILESELFGHVSGAFTGATRDKPGLLRQAHEGTLFLDEIGDMSLALQAKLLRALQEGEVRPVGGDRTVPVDVRLVTATHRDLGAMVKEGSFRDDLYYRIVVARVELPPLRERRADVMLLAEHFVRTHGGPGVELLESAREALLAHDWPGNVRELESAIRSALVMSGGGQVAAQHLPRTLASDAESAAMADLPLNLRDLEKLALARALEQCGGNRAEAAKLLGISRSSVFVKIREYDLS